MAKKAGVLLSGCGVFDGTEIHEAVLTLLALDRAGTENVCTVPDMEQCRNLAIAVGSEPCVDDTDRVIQENVPEVYKIGDRSKVRAILEAIRDGFEVAANI
jgi:enhancing lycopene biosynthesis protein 2